jgi:hypothetical protein
VALVCEAEFGGEACDVGLSVGEAVEGSSHVQPDAMAGDGVSGDRMENAASSSLIMRRCWTRVTTRRPEKAV